MRATFLQTSMSVWDADDIWSLLKTKQTKKTPKHTPKTMAYYN